MLLSPGLNWASHIFITSLRRNPRKISSHPVTNTVNSFSFSWDPPVIYYGDVNKITYYYSINTIPTEVTVTEIQPQGALSLGPGPYATQVGENVISIVAKDEAGNIDFGSYADTVFIADTTPPLHLRVSK